MILHENKNKNSTLQYYDCFSSLANQEVHPNNLSNWQRTSRSTSEGRSSMDWYGMPSVPELRSALELHGWEEGAIVGEEKFGHIKAPPLPSIKRKRCKGSYGHTLNMMSIYNGNFDKAWLTSKKAPSEGRMKKTGNVNVVVDIAGSCTVSAEAFFWRGAVGVMLARALQKSGRNVRILVAGSARGYTREKGAGTNYICTVVNAKDYGVPITLDSMFAMTALAGFFRYYIFKAWCSQKHVMSQGFGRPRTIDEIDLEPIVDNNPVIIVSDIWNEEHANLVVNELLERFK